MTPAPATPSEPAHPAGPAADPQEVDVLYLAGQRPAQDGEWLLITEADGLPGSAFSACVLPAEDRYGRGGDVLIRLIPAGQRGGLEPETIDVSVWVVIASALVPVAAWDRHDPDGWPERIRQTTAFTMGIMTALEEHGAGLGARDRVHLDAAAGTATPGVPPGLTTGPPPGR